MAEQIDESGKLGMRSASIPSASAPSSMPWRRWESPATDRVVGITQGWKLTGAIKTAERKLADGTLSHGGSG